MMRKDVNQTDRSSRFQSQLKDETRANLDHFRRFWFPAHPRMVQPELFAECRSIRLIGFEISSESDRIGKCAFPGSDLTWIGIPASVSVSAHLGHN
jgi:hypothetical protein